MAKPAMLSLAVVPMLIAPMFLWGQAKPPALVSYYGKTPVLDGVLSPGEWNDATEFRGAKDWWPTSIP